MADTCTFGELGLRMAVIEVAELLANGLAQVAAGYMINSLHFFWPFCIIASSYLITFLYTLLFVGNSFPQIRQKQSAFGYLLATGRVYARKKNGRRWKLFFLFVAYLIVRLGHSTSIRGLFELNAPLCWASITIGYFKGAYYVLIGVGTLIGSKAFQRCLLSLEWISVIGFVSGTLEYVYLSLVRDSLMMFFGKIPVMLFGVCSISHLNIEPIPNQIH